MTVPSPCTQVCTIDEATGWCKGCKRTIDEIATWAVLADDQKRAVWARLPARGHVDASTEMDAIDDTKGAA